MLKNVYCTISFSMVSCNIFLNDTEYLNHIQSCLTFVFVVLVLAKTPGKG